uniref:Uncharacterized protein n=1 Tax=Trichobilharzia regenti TaxID=157069 RepID=A0AA85KPR2_TRIRE|nr:unnamed protein product [Trichobilharzia regenti]
MNVEEKKAMDSCTHQLIAAHISTSDVTYLCLKRIGSILRSVNHTFQPNTLAVHEMSKELSCSVETLISPKKFPPDSYPRQTSSLRQYIP